MSSNYIADQHKDFQTWISDLTFWEDELKIFTGQLEEVSSKNTAQDVKMEVEKFQNQFIIQQNEIDILKHEINLKERELEEEVKSNPVATDHRKVEDDTKLRERFEIFQPIFKNMREEFQQFLGANL